jgi:hypothetical protein
MPDNNNSTTVTDPTTPSPSSSSSLTNNKSKTTTATDMPPPASKKRKRSVVNNDAPVRISAAPQPPPQQPTNVALPPPLMPYHPHLLPSYYPVYHQHPYYLSVGPQPPISPSLSPTLSSTSSSSATSAQQQRILPKSPQVGSSNLPPTVAVAPMPPPPPAAYNYYPYPIQVSPQLHPTSAYHSSPMQAPQHPGNMSPVPYHPIGAAAAASRHNSVSSSLGSPTSGPTNTTADQREHARKVSHSAIERRRRERINDKIIQLKDLIPSCADRENLHKMTILQSAIDYITYLKKVIEEIDTTGSVSESRRQQEQENAAVQRQTKSMLPKEVEPFTHQFSVQRKRQSVTRVYEEDEEGEEEEEDSWSASSPKNIINKASPVSTPLPTSSLKPMDLMKLNNKQSTPSSPSGIVVNENHQSQQPQRPHESSSNHSSPKNSSSSSNVDRHMNLENILC